MSEAKPDPAADPSTSEPALNKDETAKVAEGTKESDESAASKATGAATAAGAAVKDSVFSMFGGGPKKEKKEEEQEEDIDEPSGSSKKKTGEVSRPHSARSVSRAHAAAKRRHLGLQSFPVMPWRLTRPFND